ncbi:MAG: prepilin-type N-terminal cleavage/methylation domain-containing protein [Pseudomonadota bacterium]
MKRARPGFSLIEIMVTIVIMSVAIWALSALQASSIGTNYSSHRMTIATILAQDKVEELRTLAYNDVQLTDAVTTNFSVDSDGDGDNDDFDWTPANIDHTNADGGGAANPIDHFGNTVPAGAVATAGYSRTWNVMDDVPAINMKTVSVRVEWNEKTARSVTINTIISRN